MDQSRVSTKSAPLPLTLATDFSETHLLTFVLISAVVEEQEQVSDRPCQLGRQGDRAGAAQKHLSMSELMHWRHFSGDTHTFSDPYLDQARNHITFAFQTTISHSAE